MSTNVTEHSKSSSVGLVVNNCRVTGRLVIEETVRARKQHRKSPWVLHTTKAREYVLVYDGTLYWADRNKTNLQWTEDAQQARLMTLRQAGHLRERQADGERMQIHRVCVLDVSDGT